MVTLCSVPAGAPSVTSRPSATAVPAIAPAAADCQLCLRSITASSVALSPLTEIYGAGAWTDWEADPEFGRRRKGNCYLRTGNPDRIASGVTWRSGQD